MDIGMMWRSTDRLEAVLKVAIPYCEKKYGYRARTVHVSIRQYPLDKIVGDVSIFPLNCIMPHHYWFVRPNDPDMPELQTRTPADVTRAVGMGGSAPNGEGANQEPLPQTQMPTGMESPRVVAEKVDNRESDDMRQLRERVAGTATRGKPSHKRRGHR
jgi:hypothetical protein